MSTLEKLQNLFASATGAEKIGTIDLSQPSLYISAASIAFNPLFWNIVAQTEHKTHFLTRAFNSPYYGCYFLAVVIFGIGIVRDWLYNEALASQPIYPPLHQPELGAALFVAGSTLVVSSMYALGVTGTYLGDYFGILMDTKVDGFPFNVTSAPMYWGSTLNFLGTALYHGKPAGLALTVQVFVMYLVALQFEDPFTAAIYAQRDQERERNAKGKMATPEKGKGKGKKVA